MTNDNICRKSTNVLIQHITPCQTELSTIKVNVLCSAEDCGKKFATQSSLRMHMEKVHRQLATLPAGGSSHHWYHCPEKSCRYNIHADSKIAKHFTKMGSLKQHWLKVHAERVLTCPECQSGSFSCQRLLLAHRRSCGIPLHCALCPNSTFTSLEALQSHCRRNQHTPAQHSLIHIKERLQVLSNESREKKLLQSSGNRDPSSDRPQKTFSMKLQALDEYIFNEKFNAHAVDITDANLRAVSTSVESHPCKNSYYKKTNEGNLSFIVLDKDRDVVSQTFPCTSTGEIFSLSSQDKLNNMDGTVPRQQSITCTPDINSTHQISYCDKAMEITPNRNSWIPSENLNIKTLKVSSFGMDGLSGVEKGMGNSLHDQSLDGNTISKNNNNNLSHCNSHQSSFTDRPSAANSRCSGSSVTQNYGRHGSVVNRDCRNCQCMHNRCYFAGAGNTNIQCKNSIRRCPCKCSYQNDNCNIPINSCTTRCQRSSCLTSNEKRRCRCNRTLPTPCACSYGDDNTAQGTCSCQPLCHNTSMRVPSHGCNETNIVECSADGSRSCEAVTVSCCSTRQDEAVSPRSTPVSLQKPSPPPPARAPPHLLAAIALSELAAPAIKSVTVEKATQTVTRSDCPVHSSASYKSYDCGRNSSFEWSSTGADDTVENETSFETNGADIAEERRGRAVCGKRVSLGDRSKGITVGNLISNKNGKKIYSRGARRRKSAETQTRLTRKEKTVRPGFNAGPTTRHGRCHMKRSSSNGGSSSKRRNMNVLNNEDITPKIECVDASINTEDEGSDLNRENFCVLDAFPCQAESKAPGRGLNCTDANASKDHSFCDFESDCPQHTAENFTKISDDKAKDDIGKFVFVESINSVAVGTNPLPLSVELSSVNVGPLHSSSGTQTSPRAMVSVGIVTCETLYQDLSLALMSDSGSVVRGGQGITNNHTNSGLLSIQTNYDLQSDDKHMCSGDSQIPLLVEGGLCADSVGPGMTHSAMAIGNNCTESHSINTKRYDDTSPDMSADVGNIECNSVNTENDNLSTFPTASASFTHENMLLEDEENYVLVDRNLSEMSTNLDLNSSENMKATGQPARFNRVPKLSEIRSSSIETQTEHDILLSVTRACLGDGLDTEDPSSPGSRNEWDTTSVNLHSVVPKVSAWCTDTGNQVSFPAAPLESAWCTIETQTCEDFSDIEQFMCSSTHTQTSEQVRRELFPELSFADTQTQTGLEDLTCLVHSHTQTIF